MKKILLLALLVFAPSSLLAATTISFPWANGGALMLWDEIIQHRDTTIGDISSGDVPTMDGAARSGLLAKTTSNVGEFTATDIPVDLTAAGSESFKMAALVDDRVKIEIFKLNNATGDYDTAGNFEVNQANGGPLWGGNSFKVDDYLLERGNKYKLTLTYENMCHLTHEPYEDYDGISVYKLVKPRVDIEMQSLPEELDANGDPVSPNETVPGAFISLNDNDNGAVNGTEDKDDGYVSPGFADSDLVEVKLNVYPASLSSGKVVLDNPSEIKVFKNADKSGNEDLDGDGNLDVLEVDSNGNGVPDSGEDVDGDGQFDVDEDTNGNGVLDSAEIYEWDLGDGDTIPGSVWVEGIDTGSGDLTMTLRYDNDGDGTDEEFDDKVKVTVYKVEFKSIKFTSDHGTMKSNGEVGDDWTASGTVYSEPEWVKGGDNHPISHTKGNNLALEVIVRIDPSGLNFNLFGDGPENYWDFTKTGNSSTGADQTISITASESLPNEVDTINKSINWNAKLTDPASDINVDLGSSGPHEIFVTYGAPTGEPSTYERMSWACLKADGQTTKHGIVNKIQAAVQSAAPYFDGGKGFRYDHPTKDHWEMLTVSSSPHWNRGDCYDHALLILSGANILGASCTPGKIFASRNDGNAWNDLDYHPTNTTWELRFNGTPGYNNWEGAVRLQEGGTWYYYTSVPDLDADDPDAGDASIKLLRAYVSYYASGVQRYYNGSTATGVNEPLPPAP